MLMTSVAFSVKKGNTCFFKSIKSNQFVKLLIYSFKNEKIACFKVFQFSSAYQLVHLEKKFGGRNVKERWKYKFLKKFNHLAMKLISKADEYTPEKYDWRRECKRIIKENQLWREPSLIDRM